MFKIELKKQNTYSEMPQKNPLRWKILLLKGKEFVDQTGWIACKDFFNDSVAWFQEQHKFSVYRYNNDIEKNDEGVYVLLNNVRDKDSFMHNLYVINEQVVKDFGEFNCLFTVDDVDLPKDQLILCIPNVFWETTYRISMVSMAIRCANYGVKYTDWQDIWADNNPAVQMDGAFTGPALKCAKEYGFIVPKKYQEYWYFCGDKYNSKTHPKLGGTVIHDNGVCQWANYMGVA